MKTIIWNSEFITYFLNLTNYFSLGSDTKSSLDRWRINEVREIRTSVCEKELKRTSVFENELNLILICESKLQNKRLRVIENAQQYLKVAKIFESLLKSEKPPYIMEFPFTFELHLD